MSTPLRRSARIAAKNRTQHSVQVSAQASAQVSAQASAPSAKPLHLLRAVAVATKSFGANLPHLRPVDAAVAETCAAIRRISSLIEVRAEHDVLAVDALQSLMKAVWAIEDAVETKLQRPILAGNKTVLTTIPAFLALLKAVAVEANKDADIFSQYHRLHPSLVRAALDIGMTIQSTF